MILIGYPGVGKSTVANNRDDIIDLESSNFTINGSKDSNWVVPYINVAIDLHKQGYTVFTSSHLVVRQELQKRIEEGQLDHDEDIATISPDISLKDEWVKKLYDRYVENGKDEKNLRAYQRAEKYYTSDVSEILNDNNFYHIIIDNMVYDLSGLLQEFHDKF